MKKRAICTLLAVLLLAAVPCMGITANAISCSAKVGVTSTFTLMTTTPDQLISSVAGTSTVPGMTVTYDTHNVYLTGTPTAAGTYTVPFTASWKLNTTGEEGSGGGEAVVTVAAGASAESTDGTPANTTANATNSPVIILNPQNVTLTEGGSASFSANAMNFSWCAWRFINMEQGVTVIFDVVGDRFPGLQISGGNNLVFELKNIPVELNGWYVACMFGNNYGAPVLCKEAYITVTGKGEPTATATPMPTATPEPTPEPTATPEVTPTPEPTATPDVTATPAPTPVPTSTPVPIATPTPITPVAGGFDIHRIMNSSSGIVLIAAAVILVLGIIGIILILVSSRKRRKALEAAYYEEDEEYYDEDDYAEGEYEDEEYAEGEYEDEEYADEEYEDEEYADEEYEDEEYADEEYEDEDYAGEEYADEPEAPADEKE